MICVYIYEHICAEEVPAGQDPRGHRRRAAGPGPEHEAKEVNTRQSTPHAEG